MNKDLINKAYCDDSISFFENNEINNISLVISSPTYYSRDLARIRDKREISGGISKEEYVNLLFNLFQRMQRGFAEDITIVLVIGTYGTPVESILLMFQEKLKQLNLNTSYKLFSENNYESIVVIKNKKHNTIIPNFEYLQEYKKIGRYGTISEEIIDWAIDNFSSPNDLLVDPFVGTGGTLVRAKLKNRNYLGIDLDRQAIEIARKRIRVF